MLLINERKCELKNGIEHSNSGAIRSFWQSVGHKYRDIMEVDSFKQEMKERSAKNISEELDKYLRPDSATEIFN